MHLSISDRFRWRPSILTGFYNGDLQESIDKSIDKTPCLKNNIELLYFILERAKLCWYFSRFPPKHMVKTHLLLEYISVNIRGILRYTGKIPTWFILSKIIQY